MSSCLMFSNPFLCDDGISSVPGIAEIYVTSRKNLGYWFYQETHPYQYGIIIGNELSPSWFKIYYRIQTVNFAQTQTRDISRLYSQILNIQWNKITYYKRDLIEQMVVDNDLVFIFKDKNGKYWCYGETSGATVDKWDFGTGDKASSNETSISLVNNERYPIREVDPDYIANIIICGFSLCALTLDDLCATDLDSICAQCGVIQ